MARKCCVVTGSRAEYGLLYRLLREIEADPALELQVVATGMHLAPEFGLTVREIEQDGFPIAARVDMLLASDTPVAIAKSIGLGVIGCADTFDRLRPDIVVMLGDRFEMLAAAQAALTARIPIAHIHGGELTEGLIDEAIRHAITKMAHLHFVAAETYRRRVIQLGEAPERVFNFGAPGLDRLAEIDWLTRRELEADLGLALGSPLFLVTYHPVTLAADGPAAAMANLLAALDRFPAATVVFTLPNADTAGRAIVALIEGYIAAHPERSKAFASLGQRRYLSLMREADAVIGNSSSGLIEAPALKRATVDIGDRQRGRLKAASVIACPEETGAIVAAIEQALDAEFRAGLPAVVSPYGAGGASRRIARQLAATEIDGLIGKVFFDL